MPTTILPPADIVPGRQDPVLRVAVYAAAVCFSALLTTVPSSS